MYILGISCYYHDSAAALVVACGGSTPAQPTTTPTSSLPTDIASLDAALRAGAVVETVHGQDVSDPYRSLELDDELTWAWVDAQAATADASWASSNNRSPCSRTSAA